MSPADWIAGVAAMGMFLTSLAAAAISQGAHRQRTDSLAGDLAGLAERVTVESPLPPELLEWKKSIE